MKKLLINIEGMHCSGCSNRLEKILKSNEKITSAEVNLETKEAKVECENLSEKDIIKIIENAGFIATIK